MPSPAFIYRVLVAIDVPSDLRYHLSPIEVAHALRAEANGLDMVDDYIACGNYGTITSEIHGEAVFQPVGGQDDPKGAA